MGTTLNYLLWVVYYHVATFYFWNGTRSTLFNYVHLDEFNL